jgi:hypothetical protein
MSRIAEKLFTKRPLNFACHLVFALEAVVFFRGVLFFGHSIPWDLEGFHLPHAHVYADALARGELPLWDPYLYCGRPFQANIQTQVFYPTVALIAWLGSLIGHDHLFFLLELNVIFHTALAGMMAFRLGRVLELSSPAALLVGSVYQMGAFFAMHAQHMGAVTIAAWMPLAWASVIQLARTSSLRHALALALALAMSVLGGLTPLTAVVAAGVVLLAFLLIVIEKAPWATLLYVSTAGVFSGLLTLAQLGPSYELTMHSIAQYRTTWLKSGGGVPIEALVTLVWPNRWGAFDPSTYRLQSELTFSYLYSGLLPLVLVLLAVFAWRSRLHAVLAALMVLAGLAMLGDSTFAGRFVYSLLPVRIRIALHPEYTMPAFLLCLAILAGLGLTRFVSSRKWQWALLVVCGADLLIVNSGHPWHAMPPAQTPVMSRTLYAGYREGVERLRTLTHDSVPPWRFDGLHGVHSWVNHAPTFAIPTANGYDPLALARLIRARLGFAPGERWGAYYEPRNLSSQLLDMMNVKYLLSPQRLSNEETAGSAWSFVAGLAGFSIYENPRALPRFWLVNQVIPARDEDEAARLMFDPRFRPERQAVVEGFNLPLEPDTDIHGRVAVVTYGARTIELAVEADRPALLASSEAHYPGWRAWIDGREAALFYTNIAFRGLMIPAGQHRVVMRFEPHVLTWCAAISLVAWIAWAWFWFRSTTPPGPGRASVSTWKRRPRRSFWKKQSP